MILIDHRTRDKSAAEYGKRFNASGNATGLRYFFVECNHVGIGNLIQFLLIAVRFYDGAGQALVGSFNNHVRVWVFNYSVALIQY